MKKEGKKTPRRVTRSASALRKSIARPSLGTTLPESSVLQTSKEVKHNFTPSNKEFSNASIDLHSEENRKKLAKLMMNLFDKWELSQKEQLELLGLKQTSRSLLSLYKKGHAGLPDNRDCLDRVGMLLTIHQLLGLLYPYNENLKYHWMQYKNRDFDNHTPLALVLTEGIVGLAKVKNNLEFYCYR